MTEVLNIGNLTSLESEIIAQRFSSALTLFQEAMVPIMAQILLWRRKGERPCLNDIRPRDFFVFASGNMAIKNEFELTSSRLHHVGSCVNLPPSQLNELSCAEAEFLQRDGAKRFVRGKYMLWFLIEFALEIHRSISLIITRFTGSPKVRLSISPKNAMVVVAPRVRCPASLQEFLERTYGQFIRENSM